PEASPHQAPKQLICRSASGVPRARHRRTAPESEIIEFRLTQRLLAKAARSREKNKRSAAGRHFGPIAGLAPVDSRHNSSDRLTRRIDLPDGDPAFGICRQSHDLVARLNRTAIVVDLGRRPRVENARMQPIGRAAVVESQRAHLSTEGVTPMERKKATDFPPEVLKLFDGYIHGMISRRDFLDRAARYAVGGFTAAAMLESLRPNYAWAEQIAKTDPRLKTEYLTYPSP